MKNLKEMMAVILTPFMNFLKEMMAVILTPFMNFLNEKKGQVSSLWSFALALVVLGIVLTVGAIILVTLRDTQTASTVGYNLSNAVLNGIETFSDWIPIIVIAGVAGVVLYLVMKYLIPQLRGSSGY